MLYCCYLFRMYRNFKEEKREDETGSTECIYNDLRKERYMIYHQDLL